ncbi:Condensin complex subunit [Orbilia brochopaga]|uniref:Condensin complex subunit 1 n=1 Tax=Orbilia brochopaga TaxID=3140254 RepID=A0AAV9UIR4_9PEZI
MDGSRHRFNLASSLQSYSDDPGTISCPDADPGLITESGEPLTLTQINPILDPIVEAVTIDPDAILKDDNFDNLQCLLKSFPSIPSICASKVLDLISSGLAAETTLAHAELESDDPDGLEPHKQLLEAYGFLLQWCIGATESRLEDKSNTTTSSNRGGRGAKSKSTKGGANIWDSSGQLLSTLEIMAKVMKLKLSKMFLTTSERDAFVGLFTRPVYLILENEQRLKSIPTKMHCFKILCLAVKHHGHAFGAQIAIVQNLSYFEHLSEPMAEFLQILEEQFDYPQLADEVLREVSNKQFNTNDTKGPKSISTFLVKLSEVAPRLVLKQMTLLVKQLDSESYALRCAIIEVCGNLIADLTKEDERTNSHKSQIESFYDVLEERFMDVNPYCRSRLMQVLNKLCDLEIKNPSRRQQITDYAARSLEDKSSNVRRNAIKLLGRLVATHPFSVLHGGQLSLKDWKERLGKVDAELDALLPPSGSPGLVSNAVNETSIDESLLQDVTMQEADGMDSHQNEPPVPSGPTAEELATSEAINKLQLTRRYYMDALRFIQSLHSASSLVSQLLGSRNKSEVIEAMDFFVILDAYKVEPSKVGIRKMLRLIWTKGNSDEGRSVQAHLIDCYKMLYFEAPSSFGINDAANYVARNIISLTFGATSGELTSLEALLSTMMKAGQIPDTVLHKLWKVYGVQKKEISRTQRRGAIICLGMFAVADPEIVITHLETILRIGLGNLGKADLALAKYTCIALKHICPSGRQRDGPNTMTRLPNDHAVLVKLAAILEVPSVSQDWFGLAEQAVNAIYALSQHPDVLATEIIRRKTKSVFSVNRISEENQGVPSSYPDGQTADGNVKLSQLLFLVGHVAIKQIVHLELHELDFKRRKAASEKTKLAVHSPAGPGSVAPQTAQNELDLIGGTNEDDFTDAMQHIRERELLFGERSLLSKFGPMLTEICSSNTVYRDRNLQATATLCLTKFMCVSSEFCERNLSLLITIMEKSTDPIIRSNVVIGLGDMAVCFNHLIDENTDFLYRRLNDKEASVKRTCLMTLTFLILAGQVKVKGQLGEMAKCLEDQDKGIADLAKMFFTELATKDNAVYNHFIDVFSLLSADQNIEEDSMKRIVKFLTSFIEKDKHAKQLAEKLASRLSRCNTERQWNDVAYALSLLPHKNEEIQKVVAAGFQFVRGKG